VSECYHIHAGKTRLLCHFKERKTARMGGGIFG